MNFLTRISSKNIYKLSNHILQDSKYLCYKSSISLDKLYPNSNLTITTPKLKSDKTEEAFSGFIPMDKLKITYSRSSGPGGQHVNCVSTKVDLRFHVDSAEWLSKNVRDLLKEKAKSKISKEGFLIIRSEKTRYQQMNLSDAVNNLRVLIFKACEPEEKELSPETIDKLRKRHEKAARVRLIEKRRHSLIKQARQGIDLDL